MAISSTAGGKGCALRPSSVSRETFNNNFDSIFGRKKEVPKTTEVQHDSFAKIQPLLDMLEISVEDFPESPAQGQQVRASHVTFVYIDREWMTFYELSKLPVYPEPGDTYNSKSSNMEFVFTDTGWKLSE